MNLRVILFVQWSLLKKKEAACKEECKFYKLHVSKICHTMSKLQIKKISVIFFFFLKFTKSMKSILESGKISRHE